MIYIYVYIEYNFIRYIICIYYIIYKKIYKKNKNIIIQYFHNLLILHLLNVVALLIIKL